MLSSSFPLISADLELDASEEAFGTFNTSADIIDQPKALAQRLEDDGYLYIPGFWERSEVKQIREAIIKRMIDQGMITREAIQDDAVIAHELQNAFIPEIGMEIPEVKGLLFGERMMSFWEGIFEEPALHFDFIWLRAMGHKAYSKPHCDIVYMGRGTRQLYTAWTPYGDIGYDVGGLMLLEDSHKKRDRILTYLNRDVDSYCENGPHAEAIESGEKEWEWDGSLSKNPVSLREKFGARWLSTEFKMGDVIVFGMEMIHGSIQNQTDQIRISSDTRYQRASQPTDHRWIGEKPIAHGLAGKRSKIC